MNRRRQLPRLTTVDLEPIKVKAGKARAELFRGDDAPFAQSTRFRLADHASDINFLEPLWSFTSKVRSAGTLITY